MNEKKATPLDVQVGGAHYHTRGIQPAEFCHSNRVGKLEGDIIYYVYRWRDKGGREDLLKAKHSLELLLHLDEKYPQTDPKLVDEKHDPCEPCLTGDDVRALKRPEAGADDGCICVGSWRAIVKETQHLIGKRYQDHRGNEFYFFGIVHGDDDYYYGMHGKRLALLSCVGSIESHGFTLLDATEDGGKNG